MSRLQTFTITGQGGLQASIINFGATLWDLRVPDANGKNIPVVIGLANAEAYTKARYLDHRLYLGASIGRFAGRIANNRFVLDGTSYDLASDMPQQLHGGLAGLSTHYWEMVEFDAASHLVLKTSSPHMDGGYPGNLEVQVEYRVQQDELSITYTAHTDRPGIVNLTNHAYFNLNGGGSLHGNSMQIGADRLLETDHALIPTGKLLDVTKTPHNYLGERILNEDFESLDDVFVLNQGAGAMIHSPNTGIKMEVITNQPAMVVYTPKALPELDYLEGQGSGSLPAICFECQGYPDAPNKPHFPSVRLEAGQTYSNISRFRFSAH